MKTSIHRTCFLFAGQRPRPNLQRSPTLLVLVLATLSSVILARAAGNVEADKLLASAKEKETQAQQLRAAAAAASQKAADDEMEASAEDRQARILTAQALQLLKADANKQRAYQLRQEARQLWTEANRKEIEARNEETKVAQHKRNAEELQKAAAQLRDQPAVAATLTNDAKAQETAAQQENQVATTTSSEAARLIQRAAEAWREAEKLDPETHQKVAAPQAKPAVVPKREVK